ncbi:MAG: iron chelate uptake ABC transporter family permease subunit [Treponema sp.]|nr:iron chelate uptake ABC transporter family permease subunit [Treponema sp.]
MDKKAFTTFLIVAFLALSAVALYVLIGVTSMTVPVRNFILPRRLMEILAIFLVSVSVAYSSVIFQTITNNRILTPAIIGFESVYMFVQTVIVFVFSSGTYFITATPNFILSIAVMMLFSLLLYSLMFKKGEGKNIYFLLLVGMILGTMFSSLTTFMQMLIDPSEFLIVQARIFASFNAINQALVFVSLGAVALTILYSLPMTKYLDVMLLGRETAMSLGVNYSALSKRFLFIIAVLVSVSTALVGPVIFLGILVTNITYQLIKTHKHSYIIPTCVAVTVLTLVGGQYLVARVLNFSTTLSIIINFAGGVYFIYLLLRENKSW